MSAQATRDAQENQERDHALTEMISELGLSSESGTAIDLLVTAYRGGGARAGTPEYKKLCKDLIPTTMSEFKELAEVAVHGDPERWPGLTTPAVDALETVIHMTTASSDRTFRSVTLTNVLEKHKGPLKRYERLAPVLKELAAFLPHLPRTERGSLTARPLAKMLRNAPTQALSGPLQPLVQAFGQRIQGGYIPHTERRVLEQIIADQVLNGQIEEAFRPVADVL